MISFVKCFSSCLKTLKTCIDELDHHQVITFLSHLSSLAFLELRAATPTPAFFSLLCASTQSPLFLPHLQSLEFVSKLSFPMKFLLQIFAVPRWKTLRVKVNTRLSHFKNDETTKLLMELVEEGIDLSVMNNRQTDLIQEHKEKMAAMEHRTVWTFRGRKQVKPESHPLSLIWISWYSKSMRWPYVTVHETRKKKDFWKKEIDWEVAVNTPRMIHDATPHVSSRSTSNQCTQRVATIPIWSADPLYLIGINLPVSIVWLSILESASRLWQCLSCDKKILMVWIGQFRRFCWNQISKITR